MTAVSSAPGIHARLRVPSRVPGRVRACALLARAALAPVFAPWLLSRAVLAALTVLAPLVIALPGRHLATVPDAWVGYDGWRYLGIATGGYSRPYLASFFPLWPALVRAGLALTGGALAPAVVALALANLCSLAACVGLVLLAELEGLGIHARRIAIWAFLAYPFAFFAAAPWSEGLSLALLVWCLYALRRRAWGWVAVFAALATLAHATSALLLLPIAWEAWHARPMRPRRLRPVLPVLAALAGAPAALTGYAAFCWLRFGDPLLYPHQQATVFGHRFVGPWTTAAIVVQDFGRLPGPLATSLPRLMLDVAPVALALAALALAWRGLPGAYRLWCVALLVPILCTPTVVSLFPDALVSSGRYLLAAVPLFLATGRGAALAPRWLSHVLLFACALAQVAVAAVSLAGGWIV